MTIRVNGEPMELPSPLSVAAVLALLEIDGRRVAVEHNGLVVKRDRYDASLVRAGDEIEIVNFVGGG